MTLDPQGGMTPNPSVLWHLGTWHPRTTVNFQAFGTGGLWLFMAVPFPA